MTTVESTFTVQALELASKDGQKFLRRIISKDENWSASAYASDNWQLTFTRTIKGEHGEPDRHVEVLTDCRIGQPAERRIGCEVQSFHDSKPVYVPRPRRLFVDNSDCTALAVLLLRGSRLRVEASPGSTSSSYVGLAWLSLEATLPEAPYSGLQIGGSTMFVEGRQIVSGIVDA